MAVLAVALVIAGDEFEGEVSPDLGLDEVTPLGFGSARVGKITQGHMGVGVQLADLGQRGGSLGGVPDVARCGQTHTGLGVGPLRRNDDCGSCGQADQGRGDSAHTDPT